MNMLKKNILALIKIYQKTISPDHGSTSLAASGIFSFFPSGGACRFYPSCSEYAYQAIEKKGCFKGLILAVKRISRCHPFNKGGYDPVE